MTSIRYPYRRFAATLVAPLLVATVACAGDKAATSDSGAMAMTDSTAAAPPASAGAMDGPVAQFLATVNRGEMSSGELAISKANNAEVKAFAQQMVTEHQTAMQGLTTMASASGWTIDSAAIASGMGSMSDSAHAAMMSGDTAAAVGSTPQSGAATLTAAMQQMHQTMMSSMQQLKGLSGAAFDRAYMDGQLAGHQQTLDLLRQYTTSVQSNELRSHVTQVQGSVEGHLQKAKDIRGKLGG